METARSGPQELHVAVAEFVDRLVGELEPLQRQHHEALWTASITGEAAHVEESARLDDFLEWFPGASREQAEEVLKHAEQSLVFA